MPVLHKGSRVGIVATSSNPPLGSEQAFNAWAGHLMQSGIEFSPLAHTAPFALSFPHRDPESKLPLYAEVSATAYRRAIFTRCQLYDNDVVLNACGGVGSGLTAAGLRLSYAKTERSDDPDYIWPKHRPFFVAFSDADRVGNAIEPLIRRIGGKGVPANQDQANIYRDYFLQNRRLHKKIRIEAEISPKQSGVVEGILDGGYWPAWSASLFWREPSSVQGKILFLESVVIGRAEVRILKRLNPKALILGSPCKVECSEALRELGIPVFSKYPFGHDDAIGDANVRFVPYGVPVKIWKEGSGRATWRIDVSADKPETENIPLFSARKRRKAPEELTISLKADGDTSFERYRAWRRLFDQDLPYLLSMNIDGLKKVNINIRGNLPPEEQQYLRHVIAVEISGMWPNPLKNTSFFLNGKQIFFGKKGLETAFRNVGEISHEARTERDAAFLFLDFLTNAFEESAEG